MTSKTESTPFERFLALKMVVQRMSENAWVLIHNHPQNKCNGYVRWERRNPDIRRKGSLKGDFAKGNGADVSKTETVQRQRAARVGC
jgi:hypothetical protein